MDNLVDMIIEDLDKIKKEDKLFNSIEEIIERKLYNYERKIIADSILLNDRGKNKIVEGTSKGFNWKFEFRKGAGGRYDPCGLIGTNRKINLNLEAECSEASKKGGSARKSDYLVCKEKI